METNKQIHPISIHYTGIRASLKSTWKAQIKRGPTPKIKSNPEDTDSETTLAKKDEQKEDAHERSRLAGGRGSQNIVFWGF